MAKEYKVLKIDELTRVSEAGGVEHYYRHQVKSTGGVVFTVDIDQAAFKAEAVAPILAKAAIDADKILNL